MSLIGNERAKLTATALDRFSTVCLTVEVAAPLGSWLYAGVAIPMSRFLAGGFALDLCGRDPTLNSQSDTQDAQRMTDATYWIFFGLMPVIVVLLGLAAYAFNSSSVEADERKSRTTKEPVGGAHPPA